MSVRTDHHKTLSDIHCCHSHAVLGQIHWTVFFYSVIFKILNIFSVFLFVSSNKIILKYIPIVFIKYLQLVITSEFNILTCIVIVTIRYMYLYLTLRQSSRFWFIGNEAMHRWSCYIMCEQGLSSLVSFCHFFCVLPWNSLWGCETMTSCILQSQVFLHCWLL